MQPIELIDENIVGLIPKPNEITANIIPMGEVKGGLSTTTGARISDYERLKNKPAINEHELRGGENTLAEIGLGLTTNTAILSLFK